MSHSATSRLSIATRRALLALIALVVLLAPGCQCGSERRAQSGPRAIDEVPDDAVFFLNDHQGTPVVITDARGAVVRRSGHHPYGSVHEERGASEPYGYVGNEIDSGAGLSDFGARPYRPEAGIFLAPDPVAVFEPEKLLDTPGAFAPYTYSVGDPVNLKDATGRIPTNSYEYISENLIGPKLPPDAKAALDAGRAQGWWRTAEVLSYASIARAGFGLARFSARLATSPAARRGVLQMGKLAWAGVKDRVALIGSRGRSAGTLLRSVRVTRDVAAKQLVRRGVAADQASSYALSFSGPVTVSVMTKGRNLVRYANEAGSKGRFLTERLYPTSSDAIGELCLQPYGNFAVVRQIVTATRPSIVLQGGVAQGGARATQTLITNFNGFKYGLGATF